MKTTETTLIVYCGVDVSKSFLDLDASEKSLRFANTAEGIAQLFKALPEGAHLICEASGGYESALCAAAWEAKRPISLISPSRIRAYARSRGQLAKTDRLDAAILSAYGRERQPAALPAPANTRTQLRALLRAREYVLGLQRLEANHREHLAEEPLIQSQSQERLGALGKQLKALEKTIRKLLKLDPCAREQIERMQTVDGVGEITAWTIWADLPEIGTLQPGQSAALSGLAPYARDSGQQQGVRRISHGRATLRRVLYMAAVTASQHNNVLKAVYQRHRQKGKPAKVALIAVARKLIELLNLMIKNPNFQLAA
jgi:transposase